MWDSKFVSPIFAIEGVYRVINEWKEARKTHLGTQSSSEKAIKKQGQYLDSSAIG